VFLRQDRLYLGFNGRLKFGDANTSSYTQNVRQPADPRRNNETGLTCCSSTTKKKVRRGPFTRPMKDADFAKSRVFRFKFWSETASRHYCKATGRLARRGNYLTKLLKFVLWMPSFCRQNSKLKLNLTAFVARVNQPLLVGQKKKLIPNVCVAIE